jgi:ABC-type polar amino acid transport system ATPase subunit
MIKVADLTKQHPGTTTPTLRGVSFALERGKLAAVLGMSGSGKTTLLRCLVGLDRFDTGTISVGDLTVRAGHVGDGLRGHVGLVFQSFELFPHLTVLQNCVLAPCKVKGESRDEAESRAAGLLKDLGLGDKHGAFPDQLSGGQRQRAAIARALNMRPNVLLYDEPTSALDASLKREVLEALLRVRSQGVTQIVVTHDVQLARDAAESVLVLDDGRIAEAGAPADVLGNPRSDAARRLVIGSKDS